MSDSSPCSMGFPSAKNEETLALRRQAYDFQVENIRVNQAAAVKVNRIRDEMETLRRDNAENLKNVRQHYVARVGGKTQKINALDRQRASDAQRHFAWLSAKTSESCRIQSPLQESSTISRPV